MPPAAVSTKMRSLLLKRRSQALTFAAMKAFQSAGGTAALALLFCCLATSALRADAPVAASRTEVVFDNPDNFTDWNLSDGAPWYRESVFTAVRSFLSKQTDQMLPEGYRLKVTFTDMDLGHRSSARIPSVSGAPAFEFTYSVTDPSGAVVKHGTENLRFYTDFGNYRGSIETTDLATEIIQPEKPLLKSWAFTTLAGLKQS